MEDQTVSLDDQQTLAEDMEKARPLNFGVTASTGVSAVQIGGQTIHKFTGMGIKYAMTDKQYFEYKIDFMKQDKKTVLKHIGTTSTVGEFAGSDEIPNNIFDGKHFSDLKKQIKALDLLVIDEISMISGMQFATIDYVFRKIRGDKSLNESNLNLKPFGGIKLVLIGDFFQLPPVNNRFKSFAFETDVWKKMKLRVCYLTEQYRQNDSQFYEILSNIRSQNIKESDIKKLNKRSIDSIHGAPKDVIRMVSTNSAANDYNQVCLDENTNPLQEFTAIKRGDYKIANQIAKNMMPPESLQLKIGVKVIITANDPNGLYQNGIVGTIEKFSANNIIVRKADGNSVEIERCKYGFSGWVMKSFRNYDHANNYLQECNDRIRDIPHLDDNEKDIMVRRNYMKTHHNEDGSKEHITYIYKGEIATVEQFPLKLGYAISIHKSQGMTLESAVINFNDLFAAGMGYVALSRLRNLDGLYAVGTITSSSLRINPAVVDFDKKIK